MTDYRAWRGVRTGARLWRVRSPEAGLRVTPDGVLDLIWFRGSLVVAGADTRTTSVETRPGEVTWGLQFAPGVARALLGAPVAELTDRRVELSELVRPAAALAGSFDEDAPAALEEVFVALWRRADPDRRTLRLAASLDRAARDGLSVRETARLHQLSERSLRRTSGELFGYGLKTLMQIHRFQRALRLVDAGLPLSGAAVGAGYVDQPHFSRESRRLAGRTPAELASSHGGGPGSLGRPDPLGGPGPLG